MSVAYNGKWWKAVWSVNADFVKGFAAIIVALSIIGGAMTWMFSEKVKALMVSVVSEQIRPIAEHLAETQKKLADHLEEVPEIRARYVEREEVDARIAELRAELKELERHQYANRRDLERLDTR